MKTSYTISKNFPLKAELAKEATRFCLRHASRRLRDFIYLPPAKVCFTFRGSSRTTRSGRATRNCNRRNPHPEIRVRCKLGGGFGVHEERYWGYKDSPRCICNGTVETFVHLIAHELGHGILGFDGDKTGEFQCERFAAECLQLWRDRQYEHPGCLI